VQKLFVLFSLFICPIFLFGQKKIKLVSYDQLNGTIKENVAYLRNPVFMQDNSTLTCDSAIFYTKRNYFEAYNNVHISQQGTDIYSDQLQYDGNKKHAHLTNNVRMVDPTSVLTTNILDYDMVAKIGTYTSGGKIVNKDVTLTSKNGYYFRDSNDAYFKYNVVVVTPQTVIKSDTMRYNMISKWTYFYGPTNIKGKDDNLYTENGAYNTQTENAYFGKKNLYTQDTKSLKGDSLYYDGIAGYGKAVKNIVFIDTKDKTKLFGDLGYYYKKDQRTIVMGHAYLGIGTQDSIMINNKKRPDSLWLGADTLETQIVLQKTLKLIPKISIKADNQIGDDDEGVDGADKPNKEAKFKPESKATENNKRKKTADKGKNDKEGDQKSKDIAIKADPHFPNLSVLTDSLKNKGDSLLKKPVDLLKDSTQKKIQLHTEALEKALPKTIDTAQKVLNKNADHQTISKALSTLKADTTSKRSNQSVLSQATGILKNNALAKADTAKFNPADTVQTRTIKAYHGVKIFKSNIQAKTDSLFYTSADSTMRCYINPMIWSEGSQLIGDTVYVQFKKNKLNNLQAIRNAFLVNTPKDSLRFNQIKGRLMTGFFNDGKLNNLYVDGNAESIYYTQDDSTKVYKEMNQTLSSRIKFIFKDNEIQELLYIKAVEGALNPDNTIKKDHVLKGFSWKPTARPKSKKEVIGSALKKTGQKVKPKSGQVSPVLKPAAKTAKPPILQKTASAPDSTKTLKHTIASDTSNFGIKPILPKKDSINQVKKVPEKLLVQ